ncbi:MAG: ABC-2 family transporter protein [Spirochaetia bacterium]|nr:ABC-2 family transporter protein [Spirochaetia bacterium]
MRRLRRDLRTYAVASSTSMRERLAYSGNFLGSMFTYALFIFVFSRVWASAYAGATHIAGYTMSMALWYFIIAEMPGFGFGRAFWNLSRDIKNGQIAYMLTRPYDYIGYNVAEKFGGSLLEATVILLEGILVGLVIAGMPPLAQPDTVSLAWPMVEAVRLLFVILSLLLAGLLNFFLQMAIAMTAFWLEENEAFFWIFQKFALIIGTLIPIEFLPTRAASIAVWTPFPYLSYAPARIAVAFSFAEASSLVMRQLVWVIVAFILAKIVFAHGSRRLSLNGG